MNTSQSLATLYNLINERWGSIEARRAVTASVNIVIAQMEDEGLEITPSQLEKNLSDYVNDFVEVAKKDTNVA
jgi:hypothetical protein